MVLVAFCEVEQTTAVPRKISSVPTQRSKLTCSLRKIFPSSAENMYPVAVKGRTKLRSAKLSNAILVRSARINARMPIATYGLPIARRYTNGLAETTCEKCLMPQARDKLPNGLSTRTSATSR